MYLQTSKYKLQRKRPRRFNLALIAILCAAIVAATFFQGYVVPHVTPLFMPSPTATREAASYAEDGAALFRDGKLASAIEAYEHAIQLAPTNSDLYVALSRVQVFAHQYENAVENAQYAVLLSKSAISYAVWGEAIYRSEQEKEIPAYEAAIRQLNKSLELDPTLALTHAYLAEVLMDSDWGNWKAASEQARAAVTTAPSLMEGHRAMGYVYLMTGNYQEALDEYQKAIAIHGKLADLWIALGDCYQGVIDPQKAMDAYNNAAVLDVDNPDPLIRISRVQAGRGDYGAAEQSAELAVKLDPLNPRVHGLLGVMHYRNYKYPEAVTELELAIAGGTIQGGGSVVGLEFSPNFPISEYYWTYGLALAKVNRCSEAVAVFRMLEQPLKDDPVATENISEGLMICKEITPTPQPKA
jgi:superkiller protein 3